MATETLSRQHPDASRNGSSVLEETKAYFADTEPGSAKDRALIDFTRFLKALASPERPLPARPLGQQPISIIISERRIEKEAGEPAYEEPIRKLKELNKGLMRSETYDIIEGARRTAISRRAKQLLRLRKAMTRGKVNGHNPIVA